MFISLQSQFFVEPLFAEIAAAVLLSTDFEHLQMEIFACFIVKHLKLSQIGRKTSVTIILTDFRSGHCQSVALLYVRLSHKVPKNPM